MRPAKLVFGAALPRAARAPLSGAVAGHGARGGGRRPGSVL